MRRVLAALDFSAVMGAVVDHAATGPVVAIRAYAARMRAEKAAAAAEREAEHLPTVRGFVFLALTGRRGRR
jgi:hypothetical protein